jgi:Kef-type K+ transport system membrane component KefB
VLVLQLAFASLVRADADGGSHGAHGQDAGSPSADAGATDAGATDAGAEAGVTALGEPDASPASQGGWALPIDTTLPPAVPEPEIAPIVIGPVAVTEPAPPIAKGDRPAVVLKTILGLLILLVLAYFGGHPRVQVLERKLGVSQVITAGFPFVILGLALRSPRLGLLSDTLLAELSPLLRVGLGCIGFVCGFRFGNQLRHSLGSDIVRVATLGTAVPFVVVAAISGTLLLVLDGGLHASALRDPVFLRDALILGTAGAMTARTSTEVFRADDADRLLARILRLEELAGIFGLMVVAAYFRPMVDVSWQLPGTAWLLITIGLGTTLGLVAYFIFKGPRESPDFVVLTLGTIGFCAGAAGYLRLSPVVVAFIAGTFLVLLPDERRDRIRSALRRLERPVYLLALIVIGALWQVDDWTGWVLVPVFTVARMMGKWLGTGLGLYRTDIQLTSEERQALAVSPMGPLAIAIVVNAQLLYPGGSISHIVAAVIGGAIITEIIVQLVSRRGSSSPAVQPKAPPSELPSEGQLP